MHLKSIYLYFPIVQYNIHVYSSLKTVQYTINAPSKTNIQKRYEDIMQQIRLPLAVLHPSHRRKQRCLTAHKIHGTINSILKGHKHLLHLVICLIWALPVKNWIQNLWVGFPHVHLTDRNLWHLLENYTSAGLYHRFS